MDDGRNVDVAFVNSIHDSVAADDDFAKIGIVEVRHTSSKLGEVRQSLGSVPQALQEQPCLARRVCRDIRANFLEVSLGAY